MITRLQFTAKFNKSIPKDIPTTPGGFTIVRNIGGKDKIETEEITFDFENSATECEGDIRHFECWGADIGSFPESEYITPVIFNQIIGFSDIFVDLDEADEDVKVVAILNMTVEFNDSKASTIRVPENMLEKYNREYLGA